MKTGIDIAKISRFENLIREEIPKKIFSQREIEYIISKKNTAQTAAGIFASKEAFLKALGTGIGKIPLNKIEILHNSLGMPEIFINTDEFSPDLGQISLSITHDGEYAIAVVCIEEDKMLKHYKNAVSIYENSQNDVITPDIVHPNLPKRSNELHKGSCGRLFVLAGSRGLTGAAAMSCTSALKCGAGLITLGCAESLNNIFETLLCEVMTKPLNDTDGTLNTDCINTALNEVTKADVCLIGPGLGRTDDIFNITEEIFKTETYTVADADALYAASLNMNILSERKSELILTPHIGEFSRMIGIPSDRILKNTKKYAVDFAKEYGVTLVLKSHQTVVASPYGECLVNISGNPGMATGGSGDVLSGAIASFAAQGLKPFEAAYTGVYIHSLAADMAAAELGEYSLTPRDIIDFLPYALKFSTGR